MELLQLAPGFQSGSNPNHLLASLPADVLLQLLPKLSQVVLHTGQELYAAGMAMDAVYFPGSGIILMVANLEDGTQAEVGMIGQEGMLGSALLSGVATSFVECMVQMPGTAWRMDALNFRNELETHAPLRQLLLRYNEALHAQVMQTAACKGHHGLEQRLARWLLMAHDRAGGGDLPLTQELIAMMLGVHRPSITITAGILARAGLIRYRNVRVVILDRAGLKAASCECYGVVKRRFAALLCTTV